MKKKIRINKPLNKIMKALLACTLIFTCLIGPATSYQQAMSETQKNSYSIGNVSVQLNITKDYNAGNTEVYPVEYFKMEPTITNVGSNPSWVILGVKIPSLSLPYSGYTIANIGFHDNGEVYYPAFYTNKAETGYTEYAYGVDNAGMFGTKITVDVDGASKEVWDMFLDPAWEIIDCNDTYAERENGFYIYYFGLKKPLGANLTAPAITPFSGFTAANFQDVANIRNSDGTYTLKSYDASAAYKNLGIEMKAFAVQTGLNENNEIESVKTAWSKYTQSDSQYLFGENSIINTSLPSKIDRPDKTVEDGGTGGHSIIFYVTPDVKRIKIDDINNDKSIIYTLDETNTIPIDENITQVELEILLNDTVYQASTSTTDSEEDFTNTVNLGYVYCINLD